MKFFAAWFRRLRIHWLALRLAWNLRKLQRFSEDYDSPKSKLKRARKAAEELRAGFSINHCGNKIYNSPYDISGRLSSITEAMEAGFSYRDIGTNKEEVIGFRNGEAHKTSARLQVELSRNPKLSPLSHNIVRLAEDAGFKLEEVGTSTAELEALDREHSRKIYVHLVQHFKEWATGASNFSEDPDRFQATLTRVLSPEPDGHGFSYEELGTSEAECAELMRLARRRKVESWISFHKSETERGRPDSSITRELLQKALDKAGLTLSDFNITETELDDRERRANVIEAKKMLDDLRTPGKGWFYSDPSPQVPFRFYMPKLWGCIPGDPLFFVKRITEHLATAKATLTEIGTSEIEIKNLVRAGHIASAKFLLATPEHEAQTLEYHLKGAGMTLEEFVSSSWEPQTTVSAK